ncbi:uncharacterized protein HMPREF1541_02032 [Cyphellophora europaea CBS 101466]|uniref:Uncharacterized protein n=1 Tax=Cyphellophora europaea (strain CBS 101466) TaxID=1220924 RepID=W2S4L4_CYPE1|nr:uncharacterized protein HMPREF1541_02032 [Cyphellophora europaea CBS 101466]ETN42874.1 hypothetical protein HMPREF1541_02032 [Cyphellophora europaea CBS 101466]
MPKRWLSRTGRHNNTPIISSPKPPIFHNNIDFDFAFTDLHSQRAAEVANLSALPSASPNHVRPTTSGGVNDRPRRKPDIDLHFKRPKTSEGPSSPPLHKPESTKPRSQSEEDLIGVAIGSPGHPPMAFCNTNGEQSPHLPEHVFGLQGPFPEQARLQPAKWKKLGNLFRAKQGFSKSKHYEEIDRGYDPGPRHHWYKPRAHTPEPIGVPPSIRIDREHTEKLHEGSEPKTILDLEPSPPVGLVSTGKNGADYPRQQASLPKLDTSESALRSLPSANSSSSLLARRSRTLENLKSQNLSRPSTEDSRNDKAPKSADRPRSARRQSTPTLSYPPPITGPRSSTHSPAVSKYSLFPPTQNGKVNIKSPTAGRLGRSNTSPARLSPASSRFPAADVCPAQQRRGVVNPLTDGTGVAAVSSPEEHTASTQRTDKEPWSAAHSTKSSASSSTTMEEFFFDIKSFRDSRGVDQAGQFVMTRPDSVQVSLARTRSKLNAASRTDKRPETETEAETKAPGAPESSRSTITANSTPNPNDSRFSVTTAIFDETIAAVEAMSLPASMRDKAAAIAAQLPNSKLAHPHSGSNQSNQIGADQMARARANTPPKHAASTKLLPPDPGMPSSHVTAPRRGSESRATPSQIAEDPARHTESVNLSAERVTVASRGISPNPLSSVAEDDVSSKAAEPAIRKEDAAVKAEEKHQKPLPAKSEALVSRYRAESPVHVQSAVPAIAPSQMTPLSATSVYSQSSQKLPLSATPKPQPEPVNKLVQGAAAKTRLHDRPIEESPTIPQSPGPGKHNPNRFTRKERPPPVPEKDSKFIPISRFASKRTVEKVEQVGIIPMRMTRSATDSAVVSPALSQTRVGGYRKPEQTADGTRRPLRSETLPSANSPMLSQTVYKPSPNLGQPQAQGSPQAREGITVVQAKPAAEVSVARTVSLSRKQSARVMVPGPKLQARRVEEEAKQKSKERVAAPTGLGLVMGDPAPMPSHKKQISESSLDRDRKGPLNSNPSTPEHAIEDPVEMAEREKAQKAAIVEAAKARARARRAESQNREQKEQEAKDKERIGSYRDSQGEDEKARWEILEKRAMSPLLVEGQRGHKPGVSVNVILETA